VPIPQGEVATTPQEVRKIAEKIGKPWPSNRRSGLGSWKSRRDQICK